MKIKTSTLKVHFLELPFQVGYFDIETKEWQGGIAYKSQIISAKDGSVIDIVDLYTDDVLAFETQPLVIFPHWIDLSKEIIENAFDER